MDFDPESNLMFASSWDTMFAHGVLVEPSTGKRKNVRSGNGPGLFVESAVAKRFTEVLNGQERVSQQLPPIVGR